VFEETSGFIAFVLSVYLYVLDILFTFAAQITPFLARACYRASVGLPLPICCIWHSSASYRSGEQHRQCVPGGLTSSLPLLTDRTAPRQRKMLNPVFSPRHMRALTPIFNDLAEQVSVTVGPLIDAPTYLHHSSARYLRARSRRAKRRSTYSNGCRAPRSSSSGSAGLDTRSTR
jgi:hypothetical protein